MSEQTGLRETDRAPLPQLGAYGDPGRDPRGRVITIAFIALVPSAELIATGGSDARDARWFRMDALPPLAFDHAQILADGRAQLAKEVTASIHDSAMVAFDFLPAKFTLSQAQEVFETLRGEAMDKRNFRKWLSLVACCLLRVACPVSRAIRFRPRVSRAIGLRVRPSLRSSGLCFEAVGAAGVTH